MKFSHRETELLSVLKPRAGETVEMEAILAAMRKKVRTGPKDFRRSLISSLLKLRLKLHVFGIDIKLVSPVGRGHKAVYMIDGRLADLEI